MGMWIVLGIVIVIAIVREIVKKSRGTKKDVSVMPHEHKDGDQH
jgi:hypothetical protein